ncbi:hypothetical protein [Polaromonas sp.]|uniref:hypothetical protein n=1 Tax=Polaromonas sp. TaxID=1869339 RepID=UPI00352B2C3D
MLFQLNLTKALAASSFNAMVLAAIEKDALQLAAIRLQTKNPNQALNVAELFQEANNILPQANHPDAMRHFFATQHQIQDDAFDNAQDLGKFISSRAMRIEEKATTHLAASETPQEWIQVLSDLAEGYSYVIEAAENLQERGLVAMRRTDELQAITTRPDETKDFAKSQLFDKAMAFYVERNNGDKLSLKEQFR